MMNSVKSVALTLFAIAILAACGSSVEGETSKWDKNKQRLMTYTQTYPILKDTLMHELEYAEKKYAEAQKITDEEKKIKALQEANALLAIKDDSKSAFTINFVQMTPLRVMVQYEGIKKNLQKTKENVLRIDNDYFGEKTTYMLEQADNVLAKAKELEGKEFATAKALLVEVKEVGAEMKDLDRQLDNYYDEYQKDKREKAKQKREAADSAKNAQSTSTTNTSTNNTSTSNTKSTTK